MVKKIILIDDDKLLKGDIETVFKKLKLSNIIHITQWFDFEQAKNNILPKKEIWNDIDLVIIDIELPYSEIRKSNAQFNGLRIIDLFVEKHTNINWYAITGYKDEVLAGDFSKYNFSREDLSDKIFPKSAGIDNIVKVILEKLDINGS
jgi:DNA-binding NarL/FixJ family response regulator